MLLIENMKLEKLNLDGKDYNIILTTFATTLYNDTKNDPSDGADGENQKYIYIIIIDYNHALQLYMLTTKYNYVQERILQNTIRQKQR